MTTTAIFWGEGTLPGNLQPLLDVNGAPILTVENQAIQTVYPVIVQLTIDTVDGDAILTVDQEPLIAYVEGTAPPRYWETVDAVADGGVPFALRYLTNLWQPTAQGGEQSFVYAYLTFTWSLGATLTVTPIVDGNDGAITLPDGSTLEPVTCVIQLPQQGGTLQRRTQVYRVPLVRRKVLNGEEQGRWAVRGQRLQLLLTSTGPLGVGECMLDGIQVDYRPVRKAIFADVDARGTT